MIKRFKSDADVLLHGSGDASLFLVLLLETKSADWFEGQSAPYDPE
ncbi:MAG TPA: hypothetical protein PK585_08710 [Amphiplicatus sp.]|nr:hypothetical protein [Amphiplicatus sp.]